MKLKLSDTLSLPIEAVTQTFAILAKRGKGKTYLASVMAEEMLRHHQQIVAIDPTGAWHGLRSSEDGKRPGFPVVVFGGEHADVPLEESAGEVIAQAIVENRFSAILDLSLFRKGQMMRFMIGFGEAIYRQNREPMHLFVDEADAFAPQGRSGFGVEESRMLGAMEDLVRRGRKRGIGCTLITQRPAVLNKNVLTQAESLFALGMSHPKDIDAIKEWVNVHAEPAEAKAVIDSLPVLKVGEAWFWSPGWMGTLEQVAVRTRTTFDSSATPKPGQKMRQPKRRADINLKHLGEQIKATIDKAKDNDPKELRRRLAEMERQLKTRPVEAKTERVEVPVLKNGQLDKAIALAERLKAIAGPLVEAIGRVRTPSQLTSIGVSTKPQIQATLSTSRIASATPRSPSSTGEVSGPEQRILDALAWLESIGNTEPEQTAVAFLAGYTVGGGAFNNPRGSLRTKGLIEYRGSQIKLTDAGRQVANPPESSLTTDDIHRKVMERLPGPERKLLSILLESYPDYVSNEDLAARSGYSQGGGAFNNPRGRLRSLGLIEYGNGAARAKDLLFVG